jgi:hypothetical protein
MKDRLRYSTLIRANLNLAALASLLASPISAAAQSVSVSEPLSTSSVTIRELVLPANTEIVLRTNDELSSKGGQIKAGHMFRLTVAYDIRVQGVTVIPSGTPAVGEVTMRTGKGVFGKSGKLEIELRHVELNGQRIAVNGKYRQEGEGNTLAAVGAVFFAAGLMFVTGKSAVIPRGRELTAYTVSSASVPVG